MIRNLIRAIPFVCISMIFASMALVSVSFAAKPSNPDHNVVNLSNGYPSGPHFNLNVHGKKSNFTCPEPYPYDGYGSSVFIPEYNDAGGPAELEYVAAGNKKDDVGSLIVLVLQRFR